MPDWPLALLQAKDEDADLAVILQLIQEAAGWLQAKKIDQWAKPWPNRADRDSRIQAGLRQGKSWICWDDGTPAATITADPDEDPYWSEEGGTEPAVYVHRLVVSRQYAGSGLGGALFDWAGRTARREHGARWIRVSAWTTNHRLHAYYRGQGFSQCGFHPDDGYPFAARFQKPTARISPVDSGLFRQA
jgi:GNAT superfamily N-acetyltransferase